MEMQKKIEEEFKQALKKRDQIAISTLRMLKSALHNKEIEKKAKELKDAEVIKVIAKQVQQHQESIEQFTKGQRKELVEKETKELEILKKYLPKQLSEEEISNVLRKVIKETGAKDKGDFGKVMKSAMAQLGGKADGKLISQIASGQLEALNKEKA